MLKYFSLLFIFIFPLTVNADNFFEMKAGDLKTLDNKEIAENIINKKLLGMYDDGTKFVEIHYANGNYYISDEVSEHDGGWKITENQICYMRDIDDDFSCVNIMTNMSNEFFYVKEKNVFAKIEFLNEDLEIYENEYLHPQMNLLIENNTLFYEGDILTTSFDKINSILKKNTNIKNFVIDSMGGDIDTAEKIADLIIDYNLDTRVVNYCYSACPIIFLGGNKRMLDKGGKIGFHQNYYIEEDLENWYNSVKDDYENIYKFIIWLHEETQKETFNYMQYFLERGVDPNFAIKSLQADSDSMWYPRRKEMLSANFITK